MNTLFRVRILTEQELNQKCYKDGAKWRKHPRTSTSIGLKNSLTGKTVLVEAYAKTMYKTVFCKHKEHFGILDDYHEDERVPFWAVKASTELTKEDYPEYYI